MAEVSGDGDFVLIRGTWHPAFGSTSWKRDPFRKKRREIERKRIEKESRARQLFEEELSALPKDDDDGLIDGFI